MTIALTEDNIDDILFFARTGQLEEFRTCIHEISRVKESTPEDVIAASVEETSRNSPLHMAAANGQLDILNYVIGLIRVTCTEAKSSILDAQNAWGNTPLHWAALNGHLDAVKALIAAGANLGMKNKAGHDAAFEAEVNSKNSVVEWLFQQDQALENHRGDEEDLKPVSSNDEKEAEAQICETGLVEQTKNLALESTP